MKAKRTPAADTRLATPDAASRWAAIRGVGPARARALEEAGFRFPQDLLWWLPFRYEDRRHPVPVRDVRPEQWVLVRGKILALTSRRARKSGLWVVEAIVSDGSANIHVIWFNQPWLARSLAKGAELFLYGKAAHYPTRAGLRLQLDNPAIETLHGDEKGTVHVDRIIPVYRKVAGMASRQLRDLQYRILQREQVEDGLPGEMLRAEKLPALGAAFRRCHFPEDDADMGLLQEKRTPAHIRLIFEELLAVQCALQEDRTLRVQSKGVQIPESPAAGQLLRRVLPFRLTGAQRRVLREIASDFAAEAPMYRLLQGDVGSGKTVVAFLAMIWAAHAGFQSAFMAPTEVLARQQAEKLRAMVADERMQVGLLTSSVKGRERQATLAALEAGELRLVVGTHSLFQESVTYRNLGFVVIDEQHRFGVEQRARLAAKGAAPNVLVMTATPIPRSLSLTLYGNLDLSVLEEKPPGRHTVVTAVRGESSRHRVEKFLREQMDAGGQVFVVFPAVEESEATDTKAAVDAFERLRQGAFRGYNLSLLHGKMNSRDKAFAMKLLRSGVTQMLVATTVVEVGVDLPEASVMVVEQAERFGLAQLHQLRGRVGRREREGYCILFCSEGASAASVERLQILERTADGFVIAEEDLKLRGAGDPGGVRQWGAEGFRVANPARDLAYLEKARSWALKLNNGSYAWKENEKRRYRDWIDSWKLRLGSWTRIG